MDCVIGDDLLCGVCGKPAAAKNARRNCGVKPVVEWSEFPPDILRNANFAEQSMHALPRSRRGPGTELKKLLAKFGIVASPTCGCNAMAARMDAAGPDGAEAMIDEVLDVMKQEAARRGLPWVEMAARMLVKRAIRNARARK